MPELLEDRLAKFGGWSLETAEEVKRCADITLGDLDGILRRAIVVSAPGGTTKVTDLLIQLAKFYLSEKEGANTYENIISRFSSIVYGLRMDLGIVASIEEQLNKRIAHPKQNRLEYIDQLAAFGEEAMAGIFAKYLEIRGQKAKVLFPQDIDFFVTENFGDARVSEDSYALMEIKIREALQGFDGILVFPGYYGATRSGKIATLQRGGSDTVADIIAKAAGVGLVENWTNQDGVGRLSPQAKDDWHTIDIESIDRMTYEEAVLLSNAGFTVLHPDSIKPVKDKSIPVIVRNSKNTGHPGTLIIADAEPTTLVTGIAYKGGFVSVSYRNPFDIELQNDVITSLRISLSESGIRPSFITSQNGESLIYDKGRLDETSLNRAKKQAILDLKEKRPDSAKELDGIELDVRYGISLVSVVGRGMRYDRRTADGKIFDGIKSSGIDARLVSDEPISRMYLINEDPLEKKPKNAIRVAVEVYKQFFPVT